MLYEERERVLKLVRENDQYKLEKSKDLKKINDLNKLIIPVENTEVFFKDVRPNNKNKDLNVNGNKLSKNISLNEKVIINKSQNQLKTIYLPNEESNTLALEVE